MLFLRFRSSVSVVPAVPVVSFRWFRRFRSGVPGFSTCLYQFFKQRKVENLQEFRDNDFNIQTRRHLDIKYGLKPRLNVVNYTNLTACVGQKIENGN